jgi:hypothetical protein
MSNPTVAVFDLKIIRIFSKSRLETPGRAFLFGSFLSVTLITFFI